MRKNRAAQHLARMRSAKLTPARRSEIARRAAQFRWARKTVQDKCKQQEKPCPKKAAKDTP